MKITRLIILLTVMAIFLAGSVLAGKKDRKRKLPVGSYITSAKIEVLSKKPERIEAAIGYLNDLAEFYGPHSEAFYWKTQIYYDYIDNNSTPTDKREYVEKFKTYHDSLIASCDNEDIKKKYRKGCADFGEKVDSIKVLLWREYYNSGTEKLTEMGEIKTDMEADTDSASQSYYIEKIDALRDTAQSYFELSIILDSIDVKPWIGIGNMLQELDKLDEANAILVKVLPKIDGEVKGNMLIQVAYNYVNNSQYTESIEYLRDYVDNYGSEDISVISNMAAVYNQVDMPDSAYVMYNKIIAVDSINLDALIGAGRYHRQNAMKMLDSLRFYTQADDKDGQAKWKVLRTDESFKAKKYLQKAYEHSDDSNVGIASEYGVILFLLEDYETAVIPFTRLVTINPADKDSWATLGDCYLKLQDFDKCARAYEKVVELDPDNRPVWESLEGLYLELKETDNLANAREHLK